MSAQSQNRSRRDEQLCLALARRTGTEAKDWFPVFKARYGMRVAFDAIRAWRGDGTVLTQLFTCCTAVDPIIASGLVPRYADVDRDTVSLDAQRLELDRFEDLRTVMLQHTFGLIDGEFSRDLTLQTHAAGALIMEDCAHCVTRMARDEQGEPLADISIHSFGVEKILPTRFGGAVWVNPHLADSDPHLNSELRATLRALPQPNGRLNLVTKLYVNENRVFSRLGDLGRALRRGFTRIGLYEPPIAPSEQAGGLKYQPMTSTAWIDAKALAALRHLDVNESSRQEIVDIYRQRLRGVQGLFIPASVNDGEAQPLLRFPLFAEDTAIADRLIDAVRGVGGYAERWYRPELFPGVTDERAYHLHELDRATVSVSDDLVSRALCLPTEVSKETAAAICDVIVQTL